MIRVLTIEPAGNLWGSERALLDFVRWLPEMEIAVCCPPGQPLIPKLEKCSIRVYPYFGYALHEKGRWRRMAAAFGVARACFEFRPDIIHLNQAGCYRVALPAATLFNLPIVAHVRIFEDAVYLANRAAESRKLRGILAISEAVARAIRKNPQLDNVPVHVLYDAYVASRQKRENKVADRIACVGRLVSVKGQDILIDALHLLFESERREIECYIIGDGSAEYVRTLKAEAERGPARDAIKFLGARDDVSSLLLNTTVLACPSHREPLGRVILEAWDAGAVPVAYMESGGAAEIIAAAKGGVLYHAQTPETLAGALLKTLSLPTEEAATFIRNGRAWIEENCDPRRYGETFTSLLVQTCASSS